MTSAKDRIKAFLLANVGEVVGAKQLQEAAPGEKPSAIWLLSQVRRANLDDQEAVYRWLAGKFGDR